MHGWGYHRDDFGVDQFRGCPKSGILGHEVAQTASISNWQKISILTILLCQMIWPENRNFVFSHPVSHKFQFLLWNGNDKHPMPREVVLSAEEKVNFQALIFNSLMPDWECKAVNISAGSILTKIKELTISSNCKKYLNCQTPLLALEMNSNCVLT